VVFVSVFYFLFLFSTQKNYVYYMQRPKWFRFSLGYWSEFCQYIQDLKKDFKMAKFKLRWHMNVFFRFTVIPYNQKHILPHRHFSRLVTEFIWIVYSDLRKIMVFERFWIFIFHQKMIWNKLGKYFSLEVKLVFGNCSITAKESMRICLFVCLITFFLHVLRLSCA